MKQKVKINRQGQPHKSNLFDRCQTPAYAITPLLPYLDPKFVIWEPAMGEGLLLQAMRDHGLNAHGSDILDGRDFFSFTPRSFDCIVTNPPYSIKYAWLDHCYELRRPFALLLPIETLGAAKAQRLFERYGMELITLNKRVNFKMPNMGYSGGGAQFPVGWFTHGLIKTSNQILFGKLDDVPNSQMKLI